MRRSSAELVFGPAPLLGQLASRAVPLVGDVALGGRPLLGQLGALRLGRLLETLGLGACLADDLLRVRLGRPPLLDDLGVGAGVHLRDLVLGQTEHRPQALAHPLDALRRPGEAVHLLLHRLVAGARLVELLTETGVLSDGRVPVRDEHPDLGIQPSQVGVHLGLVIAPAGDVESGARDVSVGVAGHAAHRTAEYPDRGVYTARAWRSAP